MNGVPVIVRPPTQAGRLYPRYSNGIGIFELESSVPRPCPYGVTIDGTLILDFDENRILAGVELVAPMSAWKGRETVRRPSGGPGDLALGEGMSADMSHDWPVVVSKDVQRDMARIGFGSPDFNRAVALSDRASALLQDDLLTGFWFSLAR